jgi:hypothetical protein
VVVVEGSSSGHSIPITVEFLEIQEEAQRSLVQLNPLQATKASDPMACRSRVECYDV